MGLVFVVAGLVIRASHEGRCAEPETATHIQTVPIAGSSADELRRSVIEASRALGNGSHGAASASFQFKPELDYREVDGGCILADVRVRLDATITLPEWVSARGADEGTVTAWRRFSRYVKAHEARHEAIAAEYRDVMARELAAIGLMEDCPALGREAVAVIADVKRMHDEAQIAFDREERDRSSLLGR